MDFSDKLWIISVVSNPCRFQSRYRLYKQFADYVKESGGNLITVEAAFGERPHEITCCDTPSHIQLRISHEMWLKENLINIGVSRLPFDWQYVAWVDADIFFERPDWVSETVHQLQHYDVVQMFSHAIDLGPNRELIGSYNGFAYSYLHDKPFGPAYEFWHPGFAWAARRKAWDATSGLIDTSILGAGDHHMATALIGHVERSYPGNIHPEYKKPLHMWQSRAEKHIRRNIGYVPGLVRHNWHGQKRDRRYAERWEVLIRNRYDPEMDIKRDYQGVWTLTNRNIGLRDDLRKYFRQRNEDSIDLG